MLLKSLELQGYKTFANRTTFEFAGTVTAIVGPNGSGKSNIADSVRWVLGEQSYSLLRGKKTADMIFSGSENRPRAGMASATIVFDNSSGWLPIEFVEVAITRRAYRDGQNEYLINGSRVRLRDVSELLAQSGLAERTYTIIGQGVVDAALALKAEERRRLFEEAAGIGLHRTRREEALRRLQTTHRNLERVQDIMSELQPRLRSLERQAKRAQEFELVRVDLQESLREWYGFYWHRAQHDLAASFDGAQMQETELEKARRGQIKLDGQMKESRQKIQSFRAQLGSWHRQLAQLHTRREQTSRERAVSDERSRSFNYQAQALQGEITRLQEEVGLQRERLEAAVQEVQRGLEELAEARSQVDEARKTLQARQEEQTSVEKVVEASRQTLTALLGREGELKARLAERQALIVRLEGDLEKATRDVTQAENTLAEGQERNNTAEQVRRQAQDDRQQAERALITHRQRLVEAETSRKGAFDEQAVQSAQYTRLQAELEVLDGAEQALSGYGSGAQVLLKAAREDRLKGSYGALSSQLEVAAELEAAIAAALGEYLDAVLLEDHKGSEVALDILDEKASRGALLPLNALRSDSPISPIQDEGVLGVASELVSAPSELRPALELLLGRTLVVRDRSTARRVLSARMGDSQGESAGELGPMRAVTLRGEVFHASGPILAGRESKTTTLSRPRRRKELQNNLGKMERSIAELDQDMRGFEKELEALQGEAETLEGVLDSARQAEKMAVEAHNQETMSLEQAEREVRWQTEGKERFQAEIANGAQEIAHISMELDGLAEQSTQAQEDFDEQSKIRSDFSLEEFQTQVAHWETLSAVAGQRLDNAGSRQEERELALERAKKDLDDAQARLSELEGELGTLESQKLELRNSEVEVNDQIMSLRVLIDPAENELATLEKEQEDLLPAEAQARQALSKAEHNFAQARIGLARTQEALDTWRRRIEDDFGLVEFNYVDEVSGPTPLPLDGLVEHLPRIEKLSPEVEEDVKRRRMQLRRMGAINPEAQSEYQEVKERFDFLTDQVADLDKAEADVRQVIAELDTLMEREFCKTFEAVAEEFSTIFKRVFGGGSAQLTLTDPEDLTNTGIDIEARLPGRRAQGLSLLSGGERSLTATSLIFALLKFSPTPFCLLDEVDAMLDESNVGRFRDLLRELSQNTQFIIVTHNRNTVQVADVIYGVTMGRDSVSQIISLKMDEVSQVVK